LPTNIHNKYAVIVHASTLSPTGFTVNITNTTIIAVFDTQNIFAQHHLKLPLGTKGIYCGFICVQGYTLRVQKQHLFFAVRPSQKTKIIQSW
jgi:hypothetical protein